MSRITSHLRAVVAGMLAGQLVGCAVAPTECNPANVEAGIYVKAHCLYSGEYQRREEQKRTTLEEELRIKALFEETYAALRAEQARVADSNTKSRLELDKVTVSVNSLHGALQNKLQHDARLNQQISQLQVELEKIQQQPGQSPVQQRQALSDLMVKVSDLQKTLDLR